MANVIIKGATEYDPKVVSKLLAKINRFRDNVTSGFIKQSRVAEALGKSGLRLLEQIAELTDELEQRNK